MGFCCFKRIISRRLQGALGRARRKGLPGLQADGGRAGINGGAHWQTCRLTTQPLQRVFACATSRASLRSAIRMTLIQVSPYVHRCFGGT